MNKNIFGKVVTENRIIRGLKEIETESGINAYVITINFAKKYLSQIALDLMQKKCDGKHYYFQKTNSDIWLILAYELLDVHTKSFNEKQYSKKAFEMYLETNLSKSYPEYLKLKGLDIQKNDKSIMRKKEEVSIDRDDEVLLEDYFNIEKMLKQLYSDGYDNEDVECTIRNNKSDIDNLLQMANRYYNQQNFLDAQRMYLEVLKQKKSHTAYYNLGVTYTKKKDYVFAVQAYRESIKLNKKHSNSFFNLGFALYNIDEEKNLGKSLIYFKMAYSINSEDTDCKKAIELLEEKISESMMNEN